MIQGLIATHPESASSAELVRPLPARFAGTAALAIAPLLREC